MEYHGTPNMSQEHNSDNFINEGVMQASLLEQVTPLTRRINCLDIEQIADVCIKDLPRLIGVRLASLYILDDRNGILHLQKHNHPFPLNKIVSLNQNPPSPMILAARNKELVLISNIDTHQAPVIQRSQRAFSKNYETKKCVIAPLICQDKIVGVMNLSDKVDDSNFTCEDVSLIGLFSQLVGASIGNIKLFEKIQRQATTDGLTGLVNHKTFYEVLEKELWRSRRYGGEISLIMVDVDNLKAANDTYGHRAGDMVIKEITKRIKKCIRQLDTAARYGGDEFAIILPNTSLAEATVAAERMVKAVAEKPAIWEGKEIQLSISIGFGQYDAEFSPEDITSRSDQALYMAKQAGKNTFRVFKPSQN